MLKDKRGYTLVEMIISIGVLAVISTAILVFMTTGSKNYRYNKTYTDLQTESQLFIQQIQTIAEESLYVEAKGTGKRTVSFYTPVFLGTADPAAAETQPPYGDKGALTKKVVALSENAGKDGATNEQNSLYYYEFDDAEANTGTVVGKPTNLMAENVVDFSVDDSKIDTDGSIKVYVKFKKDNQTYETTQNITLRNTVLRPEFLGTPEPTVTAEPTSEEEP